MPVSSAANTKFTGTDADINYLISEITRLEDMINELTNPPALLLTFDPTIVDFQNVDSTSGGSYISNIDSSIVSVGEGGMLVENAENGGFVFTDETVEDGNTFSLSTDAKNNGSYGIYTLFGGTNDAANGNYSLGGDYDSIRVRAYIYLPTSYPHYTNAAAQNFSFLTIYDDSTPLAGLNLRFSGEVTPKHYVYRVNPIRIDGTNLVGTTLATNLTLNTWHYLELFWKRGDGTGIVQLLLDGAEIFKWDTLHNNTYQADNIKIGSVSTEAPASGDYYFLDDIIVDNSSIGAYSLTDTTWGNYDTTWVAGDNQDILSVDAINNTRTTITVDSIYGLSEPFSFSATISEKYSTLQSNDYISFNINLSTDTTSGTYVDTIKVLTDQTTQDLIVQANIIGSPPALPTNLQLTSGNRQITGTFTNNGGYIYLLWNTSPDAPILKDSLGYNATSFVITGLDSGTVYYIALMARDYAYNYSDTTAVDSIMAGGISPTGDIIAADYYFDAENGSDLNDGLTDSTAWKTVTKFNTTTFPAGSIIAFRDSMEYRGYWNIAESGTYANRILITNWYGSSSGSYPEFRGSTQISNWTNQGGNIWRASSTLVPNGVWGVFADSVRWIWKEASSTDLNEDYEYYASSTYIDMYSAVNPDTRFVSVEAESGTGTEGQGASVIYVSGNYVTLQYLQANHGTFNGFMVADNATSTRIYDCIASFNGYATDASGNGILNWGDSTNVRRSEIFFNSSHGMQVLAASNRQIIYTVVDSNTFYNNHHTAGIDIQTYGSTGTKFVRDVYVRYNKIYTTTYYPAIERFPAANIMHNFVSSQGGQDLTTYVYFISNLIYGHHGPMIQMQTTARYCYLYNNTLVATAETDYFNVCTYSSTTDLVAKNNIFVSYRSNAAVSSSGTFDYNLYDCVNNGILGTNYIDASPVFTDYANRDFSLQSTSPAINAGFTLGSPYNVDILGVTRPVGAGYDIGAYEYNP